MEHCLTRALGRCGLHRFPCDVAPVVGRSRGDCGGACFLPAALRAAAEARGAQDNLSRGNLGALEALRAAVPAAHDRLRFVQADLGHKPSVQSVFSTSSPSIDLVIHFAAVAFVGESVAQPLRYYHNVTGTHTRTHLT